MAMNPMQRKANMYLLIGVFVTLLITGSVIAILFVQLNKMNEEKKAQEAAMKNVYVISTDVKSGEAVSLDNLLQKKVDSSVAPQDAMSVEITENTIAKIDLQAGTILTQSMVQESDEKTTNDLRKQEYNMVILPTQIQTGDYIDIRIFLSNGVDYLVASKKKVEIPVIDGIDARDNIIINMTEAETIVMSSAIIDAYIDEGAYLYATTYVEPGMQDSLIPTYVPTANAQNAIFSNPNIEQEAKNGLIARYNQNIASRTMIENDLAQYTQDRVDNIEKGVQEQITKAKEQREAYLQALGEY